MKTHDLNGFSDSVVAPIVAGYLARVHETAQESNNSRIFFVAREGWFFKKHWDSCVTSRTKSEYLYCNRVIINRAINIHSAHTVPCISQLNFKGDLGEFLFGRMDLDAVAYKNVFQRLALNPRTRITLPEDAALINVVLRSVFRDHKIRRQLLSSRANYIEYLQTKFDDCEVIFCDLGFSGSASKAISSTVKNRITNVSFQHILEPNDLIGIPDGMKSVSVFAPATSIEAEPLIGELSILLESLFRAPENLAVGIGLSGNTIFRSKSDTSPQHLSVIHEMHELAAPSVQRLLKSNLNPDELVQLGREALDILYLRMPLIPRHLSSNLGFDDDYVGLKIRPFHRFS
jgi:hypothetical protein